jgi:hypothetical protein
MWSIALCVDFEKEKVTMEGLTEGRAVHFVLPNGEHRPAVIVKVWRKGDGTPPDNGMSNLSVFTDWTNDLPHTKEEKELWANFSLNLEDVRRGIVWATSIMYSEEPKPHTWHFIERA